MPRIAPLAAAAILALTPLAPVAGAEQPAAPPTWKKTCALCHGKQGRPSAGLAKKGVRDLSDPEWQRATSDAAITDSIRKGRPGTLMAAYEERLDAEEIAELVRFIRALPPAAAVDDSPTAE